MELRENTKKAKRDARAKEQESKADRAGTSAFEQPSLGSFATADTSLSQPQELISSNNTNTIADIYKESKEDYVDLVPSGFNQEIFPPNTNSNATEFKDTDSRITALEHHAQRTENKLASLSYAVDELKFAQKELAYDVRESRAEIMHGIRARDTEFGDLLAQQSADFDRKMSTIANMIAASSINNNNNTSNSSSNININNRATTANTPYSAEVEFVPASSTMHREPEQPAKELFPPSVTKTAVPTAPAANSAFVNIKPEPAEPKTPVWYAASSGTLHPNLADGLAYASQRPDVNALIAEQAKALDEYKAMADHRAHLRQQSEERRSPLTDRKAPTVASSPPSASAHSLPQASAPAPKPAAEGATTANEGSIRGLQEQLNLIQEILITRMDTSDSKEMNSNASPKNTKVYSSMPIHDADDKKETMQSEVKGCLPHEVPVALKDMPSDLRNRILKYYDDNKGPDGVPIKDGFINILMPEQGSMYHKIPEAWDQSGRKGYYKEEDRSDTPIKARRAASKERYNTKSYNNYYDNGDPDDDDDDGMPSRGPRHGMYHSPNPMRGKMYLVRDGREGISPDIRKEHEDRRMAIAGKYIQLHESLDAHFDQDVGPVRLKMASKKDFPHVTLDDLELDSVISFFANYDLERGRHNYNLRWKMSMFISKTVLINLGVVASKNGWNMDRLPGGSAAHADDKDLRILIHEEVRAKSLDDFMNKMNQVPYFERPEDEGFRPEAYTFDQFMKFNMNFADRYCGRAEIIAAGAHGEHLPYIHKKDNVKGLFHSALKKFPDDTGIHLWEKSAFANTDLRNTKCLRDLFQKFFAVLDPYKKGRLVSDDFNTVIKHMWTSRDYSSRCSR